MKNGFKAMDSDMHVIEPCDLWQKYIDKKFLDRAGCSADPDGSKARRQVALHRHLEIRVSAI